MPARILKTNMADINLDIYDGAAGCVPAHTGVPSPSLKVTDGTFLGCLDGCI